MVSDLEAVPRGKNEKMSIEVAARTHSPDYDGMTEKSHENMFGHFEEVKHVKQGLQQRHISMIALVSVKLKRLRCRRST